MLNGLHFRNQIAEFAMDMFCYLALYVSYVKSPKSGPIELWGLS